MVAVALHPEVRPVDLPSVEEHIHQLKQAAAARASKGAGSPQDGVPTQRESSVISLSSADVHMAHTLDSSCQTVFFFPQATFRRPR